MNASLRRPPLHYGPDLERQRARVRKFAAIFLIVVFGSIATLILGREHIGRWMHQRDIKAIVAGLEIYEHSLECGETAGVQLKRLSTALAEAKALWVKAPYADYDLRVKTFYGLSGYASLTRVRRNRVAETELLSSSDSPQPERRGATDKRPTETVSPAKWPPPWTAEYLFEYVQKSIERKKCRMVVLYDPVRGYVLSTSWSHAKMHDAVENLRITLTPVTTASSNNSAQK